MLVRSLGAPILIGLGEGDAAKGHLDSDFDTWLKELLAALKKPLRGAGRSLFLNFFGCFSVEQMHMIPIEISV